MSDYLGEVFGVVVRSRGLFPRVGASLRAIPGGELATMTSLLREARQQAVERMEEDPDALGADAVVGMRFDVSTMGGGVVLHTDDWTEVCAYGTAVKAQRAPVGE